MAGLSGEYSAERYNYLAEGNAKQARKRVAVDLILKDSSGRILLVDPDYKEYWDIPGGMAEANESLLVAARRELGEELGLKVRPGRLLVVSWVEPHGPWDDQLVFIFDGGLIDDCQAERLTVRDSELRSYRFASERECSSLLRPDMAELLVAALANLEAGTSIYLENHRPPND